MWSSVGVKDNCKQCNGCEIPFEDNRNQHRQYLEGMNNFIFLWRHFIHSTEFRKAINQQQKGPSSFLNLTVMHLKQPQSNISKNYNCIQLLEGKALSPYRDLHLLPPLASISKINTIDQDKRDEHFYSTVLFLNVWRTWEVKHFAGANEGGGRQTFWLNARIFWRTSLAH